MLRRLPTDSGYSVLSDFGIAISEGQSRLTAIGNVIGTENYSPESNSRDYSGQEASFSGDNYALALIAFEMLTMYHLKEMMPDSAWRAKRTVPAMGTRLSWHGLIHRRQWPLSRLMQLWNGHWITLRISVTQKPASSLTHWRPVEKVEPNLMRDPQFQKAKQPTIRQAASFPPWALEWAARITSPEVRRIGATRDGFGAFLWRF